MKIEKRKMPVMGIYFPSEFPNLDGDLLINFKIDNLKYIKNNTCLSIALLKQIEKYYKEHPEVNKYTKGCMRRNNNPDGDGNLYFAFLNTYFKNESSEEEREKMVDYINRLDGYIKELKKDIEYGKDKQSI